MNLIKTKIHTDRLTKGLSTYYLYLCIFIYHSIVLIIPTDFFFLHILAMGKKTPKSSPKKQQGSAGPSSPKLQQPANEQGAPSKTQAKVPTPTTNQQPTQQQTTPTPTKQPVPAQQEMVSNQVQSTLTTDSRTAEQNTVSMQEKCIASQNVPAVELDDVPLPGAGSEKVRKCKDKLMEKLEAM